jgi:hypothetical protein
MDAARNLLECRLVQLRRTDMPDIASVLGEEIVRLSRKESRSQGEPTGKATIRHRREIAELTRQWTQLHRQVALLQRRSLRAPATVSADATTRPRS